MAGRLWYSPLYDTHGNQVTAKLKICCGLCMGSCVSRLLPGPPSPAPAPRPLLAPQSSSARAGGSNLQAARGQPKRSCLPLLCFIRKQNIRFPVH
ncbi:Germ cell-less protein-like 1 [Dissostichus eleginoides]|uniref:Germ cell-less protein-like 1 n=1 Tax=Dissostichus eleginoides TaxID=100907 RepID=A0AAD9F3Y8_DISEL|nr:Germ cell-less protein-like 1 [Dissostichus eleginoides]